LLVGAHFELEPTEGGRLAAANWKSNRHDECVTLDGPSPWCDGSIEEAGGSPQ